MPNTTEGRFWAKVEKTPTCWLWTGADNGQTGHGKISRAGKTLYVYRYAYELLVGPIPNGLEIDHLCRNPRCVRPDHLEPVTHQENLRRMQLHKDSKSGHRGVFWSKQMQKWQVKVCIGTRQHHGGFFTDVHEAGAAAAALRARLYG